MTISIVMETYIYESPDKGETVYRREFLSEPNTRELIKNRTTPTPAERVFRNLALRDEFVQDDNYIL